MTNANYLHVDLRGVPSKAGVRAKSADVVRISPDLAMVHLTVDGRDTTIRFDIAKQAFLDSLGTDKHDRVVLELREPLTSKITSATMKLHQAEGQAKLGVSSRGFPRSKREPIGLKKIGV